MKDIEILATFKQEEYPVPLRFKVETENGPLVLRVGEIICCRPEKKAGIPAYIYECCSVIGKRRRRYELKYIIQDARWFLYKI